jgi:hypothetical protein
MPGEEGEALVRLLQLLDDGGYHFVTVTPETHRRVVERRGDEPARDARDVFGWSLPFSPGLLGTEIALLLEQAHALERHPDGRLRSRLRVSSLSGRQFLHSAWPTEEEDSVFFGPDTYRFARFIEAETRELEPGGRIVDMGAGSGPGGILAGGLLEAAEVTLIDVNPRALLLAEANAAAAGLAVETLEAGSLGGIAPADLIISNPPFIADPKGRSYRDGGDGLGTDLSLQWAVEGAALLKPGGRMLLYTGSPIVGGEDRLLGALIEAMDEAGCTLRYEELDPDIFGEELDEPAYAEAGVERIAAVGAVIIRS